MGNTAQNKIRLFAFYLPQFHPIPENDQWWEKGFTEWTNVVKAKPLFRGHRQPCLPADLSFYDLRVPEVRQSQADMAQKFGIEGFCYWHYWFTGKRLLDRPFSEVLSSKTPKFPFCLAWANHTWSGIWHGCPERILIKQEYSGIKDHKNHFYALLPAFQDERYLTVHEKKIFLVYKPRDLPYPERFTDLWRKLALKAGLKGFYFIGIIDRPWEEKIAGFDAFTTNPPMEMITTNRNIKNSILNRLYNKFTRAPHIYKYKDYVANAFPKETLREDCYPCIVPNWDNTPRSGIRGYVLNESTPELYGILLKKSFDLIRDRSQQERIVFIKSWNEWAEGNHLEPEQQWGTKYLEVTRDVLSKETAGNLNNSQ